MYKVASFNEELRDEAERQTACRAAAEHMRLAAEAAQMETPKILCTSGASDDAEVEEYITFPPGPKLAALVDYFTPSVRYSIGQTWMLLSDSTLRSDAVRDDIINYSLADQWPEIPDVSVWEYIAENEWIASLGDISEFCSPEANLYSAAHDYLAMALLIIFRRKYREWSTPEGRRSCWDECYEASRASKQ